MSLKTVNSRLLSSVCAFLLMGLAHAEGNHTAKSKLIERILDITGLERQLVNMQEGAKMGFNATAGKADGPDREKIHGIIMKHLNPTMFSNDLKARMMNDLSEEELGSLAEFYGHPLLLELAKENELRSTPEAASRVMEFYKTLDPKTIDEGVMKKLEERVSVDPSMELLQKLPFVISESIMEGMMAEKSQQERDEVKAMIKSKFEPMQGQIRQGLVEAMAKGLYYSIKDWSKEKIQSFLNIKEGKVEKKYSVMAVESIMGTAKGQAYKIGLEMGKIMNDKKQKSKK